MPAQKLLGTPGDAAYGPLAVVAAVLSDCRVCGTFDRGRFDPSLPLPRTAAATAPRKGGGGAVKGKGTGKGTGKGKGEGEDESALALELADMSVVHISPKVDIPDEETMQSLSYLLRTLFIRKTTGIATMMGYAGPGMGSLVAEAKIRPTKAIKRLTPQEFLRLAILFNQSPHRPDIEVD